MMKPTVYLRRIIRSRDRSYKFLQSLRSSGGKLLIETGRYRGRYGEQICLSSQVGCPMACRFCKAGQPFEFGLGDLRRFVRNLTADEIVDQATNALGVRPFVVSGLTFAFMGMGEPLLNLDNIEESVCRLGQLYPGSEFVISTIGPSMPLILDLTNSVVAKGPSVPIWLQVSLHAATDSQRKKIMPGAHDLHDTIAAAEEYALRTGRIVKINYMLIEGYNDGDMDAIRLASLLVGRKNLVVKISTMNEVAGSGLHPSTRLGCFSSLLVKKDIPVYVFESKGADIEAGCGQLAKGLVL